MKPTALEHLKQRAKAGDRAALQELRDSGFFEQQKRARGYAASHAQERLWLLDRMNEGSAAYNVPGSIVLRGPFHAPLFWRALRDIAQRHEALRTTFASVDGAVRQFVHDEIPLDETVIDLTSEADPMQAAKDWALREAAFAFDLQRGPLLRAKLLRIAEDAHVFLYNLHHIICDEWSLGILISELSEAYEARLQQREPLLAPMKIQYKDFAAWQNKKLAGEAAAPLRDYWHTKLAGALPRLDLPLDYPRPAAQTNAGATLTQPLNANSLQAMQALGQSRSASLFVTLTALVKAFLYRYTGQEDLVIGAPFAGRTHPDVENMIGFFVNTICLRDSVDGARPFTDLLQNVQGTVTEAVAHQDYPFDQLVSELETQRDPSRSPLFDVVISLQHESAGGLRLGEAEGEALESGFDTAKFDLIFDFTESPGGLLFRINYNTDLFAQETIQRMGAHFARLLEGIAAQPEAPINQYPLLNDDETRRVLHDWNATQAAYPESATVLSLFEDQARRTPERTAVVFGEQSLSYQALNQRANQIARRIARELDAQPEERIAIFLERSDWMVAAILAAQKAGAAYVPVDPEYPGERIRFMLEDCGCRLVVSDAAHLARLRELAPSLKNVDLREADGEEAGEVESPLAPGDAAYVIYTSGSTGKPKGCVVTHRNVVRLMVNDRRLFDFNETDVWVVAHSFCFDFSVWEMYGALLYGGKLVVAPRDEVRNVEAFHDLLRRHRVTVLNQTPAAFYNLVAQENSAGAHSLNHLRYVIFGGDRLEPTSLRPWVERYPLSETKLINMYGITETTVHVTYYEIQPKDVFGATGASPIGTPIPGTTAFVCNEAMQLQPPGVAGEILVGGDGVSCGYLNREALTQERFIENPFGLPGRLYRSGDLGRWSADGRLEHLGRNDDQVQVRGFRVELGEIESAVAKHPAVERCVALAQGDDATSMRLVAYVSPDRDRAAPLRRMLQPLNDDPDTAPARYELPNGLSIAHQNKSESDFLYEEIFTQNAYLKHGASIHDGDCIIDVGGNIGMFSVFAALQARDVTLYSFEPIPPVYKCLRNNLQWYSPQSRAFELGLSDQPGEARFVSFPYNTVVSGKGVDPGEVREVVKTYLENELRAQGRECSESELEELLEERLQSQEFDCRLSTLSTIIREQNIERIDLLKVDVEQSELEVLLGIDERDWDKISQIVIEAHDVNGRLDAVVGLLKQHGFSLEIEQDAALQNTNLFNLFAVRPERSRPANKHTNRAIEPRWCGESALSDDIRNAAAPLLPDYMLPAAFVFVDEFPLTANGKIDRKALASRAEIARRERAQFVAPRNEKESQLAELWREVLELDEVGVFDNFFECGGHSLKATQLVSKIHQVLNVKLPLRLVFQRPTIAELATAIESGGTEAFRHIEPTAVADRYPLSHAQRRLWLIERMGASRLAYVISEAFRAPDDLDAGAFQKALNALAARHESLRTVIIEENDEPWQTALDAMEVPLEIVEPGAALTDEEEREIIMRRANQPFDLTRGPLFRASLFRFANNRNVVLFSIHHIISDGWSMDVLLHEAAQLYDAVRRGQPPALPALRLQYKDYAVWQNAWLQSEDVEGARRFWCEQYQDGVPVLDLPADRPRPAVQSYNGGVYSFELDANLSQRLWMFGRDRGASPFVAALAAVYALLYRWANQDDVVIGSPTAGREHVDLEGMVGFFVNMLPLRCRINGDAGFAALLEQARDRVAQALTFQAYPFDRLVDELELQRDLSRSPLFDVAVTLQNKQQRKNESFAIEPYPLQAAVSKFDLTFFFSELSDGRCGVGIEFNADLFDRSRIARMARSLQTLIASALAAPKTALHSLPLLTNDERRLVVEDFNAVAAEYPKHASVAQLFEAQAKQTPDAVALVCGDTELTYQHLNQKANALAARLRARGLQREECVGVLMERSERPVIAALAVLKAGGAYVPLDPAYPQSRIQYILNDAQCCAVLSEAALIEAYSTLLPGVDWVDAAHIEDGQCKNPANCADGASLAYVIYTSGSTGEPKGSLIEQRSITRLVRNTNYIQIKPSDCILQTGSLSFDASTFEIWGALLNGACVCMPHEDDLLDPARLAALIKRRRVSVLFMTTSLFNQFAEALVELFAPLRALLTGGEKVSVKHINRVRAHCPSLALLHVYGPTENTTFSTYYPIVQEQKGDAPIGGPIANSTVYILNPQGQTQPIGVPGEICVGGDGVARGYLNREALTREKFIDDPFRPGAVMYKTGDLGAWNEDGTVSFIGRIDNQAKIRGFRVEPGEIEIRLQALDEIDQAAVEARLTSVGTKELVAYYSTRRPVAKAQLRERLAENLPDYMVPSRWIKLERLPLNRNGKIDRKQLPEPDAELPSASKDAPPRNETEQTLLEVWRAVLGRPGIGIHDNYFEAGGDSIRAIQIVSRLRQLGWDIEIRHLFQHLTVAELAPKLSAAQRDERADETVEGEVKLTPIQRWFFDEHADDIHHFNQSVMLKPSQPIDVEALKKALMDIWAHHDALRMQYHKLRDADQQYNRGLDVYLDFAVVDCRAENDEDAFIEQRAQAAQAGFDLQNTPLMKAVLFETSRGQRLLWIIHHLVVDGVSWRILLEDLDAAYSARANRAGPALPKKTASFQQWAEALHDFSQDAALEQEAVYWREALAQSAAAAPRDDKRPNVYGDCDVVQLELSDDETKRLLVQSHHAFSTEMNDLLLTALGRAMSEWAGGDAFWITLEGHGREALTQPVDVSRTVGWFTSMFPFLLRANADSLARHIKLTKEALRAVPRKGMSYGALRYLSEAEGLQAPPAPLSFNYLGQFDAEGGDGVFSIVDEACGKTLGARLRRDVELELVALVANGRMALSVIYNHRRHKKERVEDFLQTFRKQLNVVSEHCSQQTASEITPSDCTDCPLSLDQFDELLNAYGWRASEIEDVYPLSPMQQGLLFQSIYQPQSQSYCLQTSFRLSGGVSIDAFEKAWTALCERHAIFRTAFIADEAAPLQVVLKQRKPEWRFESIAEMPIEAQDEWLRQKQEDERRRGFDFARDALMRIHVYQLGDDQYQVIWSYHHLLLDGWCLRLVYQELYQLYGAFAQCADVALPEPPRYGDYIAWLQQQDAEQARDYWAAFVAGYEAAPTLAAKRESADAAYLFQKEEIILDETATATLNQLAARANVTLNTVIQTGLFMILQQHAGRDDVMIGSIVSGRAADVERIEDMLGLFINALPTRAGFNGENTVYEALGAVQQQALESETYSYYPLAEIQALAGGERDLFDALMVFANYPTELDAVAAEEDGGAYWSIDRIENFDQTHYDLNLIVAPGARLQLKLHYNGAAFDRALMARMARQLEATLNRMAQDADAPIKQISILAGPEYERVIHQWNQTQYDTPRETIIDAFLRQVETQPDAIALTTKERLVTYAALNREANRIANSLREQHHAAADNLIGVLMERSVEMVAAVLGVLKSGAAYVPMDPNAPDARIERIIQDSNCKAVVADEKNARRIERAGRPVLLMEDACSASPDEPGARSAASDLAYVIYTSGSTGLPKGCLIEHRNLAHYLHWANAFYYGERDGGAMGLHSSISIDMTVTSLFLPLLRGKTLRVFGPEDETPDMLSAMFQPGAGFDCVKLTPSHISVLKELDIERTDVSLAIVGGEALPMDCARFLHQLNPAMRVMNEYGPTETTVGCIVKEILPDEAHVLIGKPIHNTQAYILDPWMRPAPIVEPGEIYIGGAGVGRGYHHRDALTRERFVSSPFSPGELLYRTGDVGVWTEDGNLDYLGRNDDQVKVRGYRIELGEVEDRIQSQPGVSQAAVALREVGGEPELVAYFTAKQPLEYAPLRDALAAALPDYCIPRYWMQVEAVPLSPSGKADKKALPAPQKETQIVASSSQPSNETERQLADIWREVLNCDSIGVHDRFFEIGGHSLKAMQIASRIHKRLGVKMALRDLFAHPTIAELAALVRESARDEYRSIEPAPIENHYELSFAQKRLWFIQRAGGAQATAAYNMPKALLLEGEVNVDALNQAFTLLLQRHEALRTGFIEIDGEPRQVVHDEVAFAIKVIQADMNGESETAARKLVEEDAHAPFDLSQPPLLRGTLIKLGAQRAVFVLTVNHIIGDGWSMQVLFRDLLALYQSNLESRSSALKPLRIQYKDFARWQNQRSLNAHEAFWFEQLRGKPDSLRLPYDRSAAVERDFQGGTEQLLIDASTTKALWRLAQAKNTTLSNVVLTFFYILLYQWTRQDDLCVGVSIANRTHPDLEGLIGFFVNILPVRVRASAQMEFDDFMQRVIHAANDAYEHQEYPFDLLVQKLNPHRAASRQPLVNVVYGFQNFADIQLDVDGAVGDAPTKNNAVQVRDFDLEFNASKFDLTLFASENESGLELNMEYDSTLFDASSIRRLLDAMGRFVQSVKNEEPKA